MGTQEELLIARMTEEIIRALEEDGVTPVDLANRLGTSRSFVTQLLSGSRNLTTQDSRCHRMGTCSTSRHQP